MGDTDRLEKVLAVMLLQSMMGASQQEKAMQLNLAGFSSIEIADLLETATETVAVALSRGRHAKRHGPRPGRKPAVRSGR
jgi:DNA-directed RNA polymerase specialized sigma24 family protein